MLRGVRRNVAGRAGSSAAGFIETCRDVRPSRARRHPNATLVRCATAPSTPPGAAASAAGVSTGAGVRDDGGSLPDVSSWSSASLSSSSSFSSSSTAPRAPAPPPLPSTAVNDALVFASSRRVHTLQLAPELLEDFFVFSFVRDPAERIISSFHQVPQRSVRRAASHA